MPHASPQALHKHFVPAIHTDGDAVAAQCLSEGVTGELATLIGIEYLRLGLFFWCCDAKLLKVKSTTQETGAGCCGYMHMNATDASVAMPFWRAGDNKTFNCIAFHRSSLQAKFYTDHNQCRLL